MYSLLYRCSLLFVFLDLSFASLSIFSTPSTNGSYCPGKVIFTCVGIEIPLGLTWRVNGSTLYTYTFPNDGSEMFPEVVFSSDIANVTVINASFNTSLSTHNITSVLIGNVLDLMSSEIFCRTASQKTDQFDILRRVPDSYENPLATPMYGLDGTLSKIAVSWNLPNGLCVNDKYSFGARLKNGSNVLDEKIVMCTTQDVKCNVTLDITSQTIVDNYSVEIISLDYRGANASKFNSDPINYISSVQPNNSVEFFSCSVRCLSSFSGTCEIQYSQNMINGSLNGTVNSNDIRAPEELQSGTIYFTAIFSVNGSSFPLQNSTNVQYNTKWTDEVLTWTIIGILLIIISFIGIITIIGSYIKRKTFKDGTVMKVVCIASVPVSSVFLLVGVCVWIAGVVEVSKSGNCDSSQQPLHILIAACVLLFFNIILELIIFLLLFVNNQWNKLAKEKPAKKDADQEVLDLFGVSDEQRKQKGEFGITKAEDNITQGHKKVGEGTKSGYLRVKEQLHQAATAVEEKGTDSNIYHTTEQVGRGPKKQASSQLPNEYSHLNKENDTVESQNGEYVHLNHNIPGTSDQPPVLAQGENTTANNLAESNAQYGKLNKEKITSTGKDGRKSAETQVHHSVPSQKQHGATGHKSGSTQMHQSLTAQGKHGGAREKHGDQSNKGSQNVSTQQNRVTQMQHNGQDIETQDQVK